MNSPWKVKYIPKTESTQTDLKTGYDCGKFGPGQVLVALSQSKGRGRLNHAWCSPLGNLAMSLIIKVPQDFSDRAYQYNLLAGLAVRDVLEAEFGQYALVKWPNDVFLGGKKMGGILSEVIARDSEGVIVIGIGVNLNSTADDFPEALRPHLTTLRDATGQIHDLKNLVTRFLACFDHVLNEYHSQGFAKLKNRIEDHLLWRGQKTEILDEWGEKQSGILKGLDEDGFLLLRDDKNNLIRILAGNICFPKPLDVRL